MMQNRILVLSLILSAAAIAFAPSAQACWHVHDSLGGYVAHCLEDIVPAAPVPAVVVGLLLGAVLVLRRRA